jgi:hypothetical protein
MYVMRQRADAQEYIEIVFDTEAEAKDFEEDVRNIINPFKLSFLKVTRYTEIDNDIVAFAPGKMVKIDNKFTKYKTLENRHHGVWILDLGNVFEFEEMTYNLHYLLVNRKIKDIRGLRMFSNSIEIWTETHKITLISESDCCDSISLIDFEGDVESLKEQEVLRVTRKWVDPDCVFYEIQTSKEDLWLRFGNTYGNDNAYGYAVHVSAVAL